MAIFCSVQWKKKRVQSTWYFSWLFFVWFLPTTILPSRERSKGWTCGGITPDKRHWRLIWREIWTELFWRVLSTTFSIRNSSTKMRKKSSSLYPEKSQSVWSLLCQCSKIIRKILNWQLHSLTYNIFWLMGFDHSKLNLFLIGWVIWWEKIK